MEKVIRTILNFVEFEDLSPPLLGRVIFIDGYEERKGWIKVYEGVYINLESESLAIEKGSYDITVFRLLVGVFALALYNTYSVVNPELAVKYARKYFFKTLVSSL